MKYYETNGRRKNRKERDERETREERETKADAMRDDNIHRRMSSLRCARWTAKFQSCPASSDAHKTEKFFELFGCFRAQRCADLCRCALL